MHLLLLRHRSQDQFNVDQYLYSYFRSVKEGNKKGSLRKYKSMLSVVVVKLFVGDLKTIDAFNS